MREAFLLFTVHFPQYTRELELHPFFKWTSEVNGTRSCLITISSLDSRSKAYNLEINTLLHYVLLLEKWNERLVLLYVKINILERTTEWKNGKELGRKKKSMKLKEGGKKWREEGKKESRKEGRKEGGNEEGGRKEKRKEGREEGRKREREKERKKKRKKEREAACSGTTFVNAASFPLLVRRFRLSLGLSVLFLESRKVLAKSWTFYCCPCLHRLTCAPPWSTI